MTYKHLSTVGLKLTTTESSQRSNKLVMHTPQRQQLMLLLLTVSLLSAVHAAPSARIQCWTDEHCDDESVTVACNNVTSDSPSSLSSACYCLSGNAYRCADLCQLGDRDVSQICATVCPAYLRCTSGEAVNAIEFAAVESPTSGSSLEQATPVPTHALWALTVLVVPIAGGLAMYVRRRKSQVVEPIQESLAGTATELREISNGIVSNGDGDLDRDFETLMNAESVL